MNWNVNSIPSSSSCSTCQWCGKKRKSTKLWSSTSSGIFFHPSLTPTDSWSLSPTRPNDTVFDSRFQVSFFSFVSFLQMHPFSALWIQYIRRILYFDEFFECYLLLRLFQWTYWEVRFKSIKLKIINSIYSNI